METVKEIINRLRGFDLNEKQISGEILFAEVLSRLRGFDPVEPTKPWVISDPDFTIGIMRLVEHFDPSLSNLTPTISAASEKEPPFVKIIGICLGAKVWLNRPVDKGAAAYLEELQTFWKSVLSNTKENGPNLLFLQAIYEGGDLFFSTGCNPWIPVIVPPRVQGVAIDHYLAHQYARPFINREGEAYRRLRTCEDPECNRLFVYNRPKQKFCSDDCRYHFHNVIKIRNGYMAEHQRKGRKENPATYLLK